MHRWGALWLVSMSALGGCASSGPYAKVDLSKLPGPSDLPGAPAVVLAREVKVRFHEVDGRPVADVTDVERTRILTDKGRTIAGLHVWYRKGFEEVLEAGCRITAPDGAIEDRGRAEARDQLAVSEGTLYQDQRVLSLDTTAAPGSVVECRSVSRSLEPEHRSYAQVFRARVPIERATLEVEAPADWTVDHVAAEYFEAQAWAPEVRAGPSGTKLYAWARTKIPASEDEPFAPSVFERAPVVWVRLASWVIDGKPGHAAKDFEERARWIEQLGAGTDAPSPEIERQVQEILAGASSDPKDRARRLYTWVQENVRYVAVEIGIGGWKPHSAPEVFTLRYGDCKDKATLLKAMLKVAGIESRLAALYAHGGLPHRWLQPTLSWANHAILAVDLPDGTVIADPTTRSVPFGELPGSDQEAELLLVGRGGASVLRTPASRAEVNSSHVKLSLALAADGSASGTHEVELSGLLASALRDRQVGGSATDLKELATWLLRMEKGTLAPVAVEPARADGTSRAVARGTLHIPRVLGGASDGPRVLRLSELFTPPGSSLPARPRVNRVVLPRRERRTTELRLELPAGATIAALPAPVSLSSEVGRYTLAYALEGAVLVARSEYVIEERVVPAEKYGALKAFFDGIIAAESAPVVVRGGEK